MEKEQNKIGGVKSRRKKDGGQSAAAEYYAYCQYLVIICQILRTDDKGNYLIFSKFPSLFFLPATQPEPNNFNDLDEIDDLDDTLDTFDDRGTARKSPVCCLVFLPSIPVLHSLTPCQPTTPPDRPNSYHPIALGAAPSSLEPAISSHRCVCSQPFVTSARRFAEIPGPDRPTCNRFRVLSLDRLSDPAAARPDSTRPPNNRLFFFSASRDNARKQTNPLQQTTPSPDRVCTTRKVSPS